MKNATDRPALVIRDAHTDDIAFVVAANAAMALETERKTLDPATLQHGVAAVIAQSARGFYLIAERAGARVGCVLITREWSDWRNGDWWWLQSVYVVPDARRSGVFSALYADVERRMRIAGNTVGLRLYVERDNVRAQATYAALGMHETAYRLYEREAVRGLAAR
ncbi:MAG: GNAT family N-acetyltransferase [Rhodanobacter sp.]|jgi:ribosomal protein S18 acetylase RimI-like enzyme|nr:GNAT family N-acetyltransferase [Rhodanobacter sp.]